MQNKLIPTNLAIIREKYDCSINSKSAADRPIIGNGNFEKKSFTDLKQE